MSGPAIAWYRLKTNAPMIAQVPAARIFCGPVPINTTMPAIGVTSISNVPGMNLSMTGNTVMSERVQVTVYAGTYPLMKSLMALIRTALANTHGTVNSINCESITPAGEGPDFYDDVTLLHEQSADYMIKWHR